MTAHSSATEQAWDSLRKQIAEVEADPEVMPACMLSVEEARLLVACARSEIATPRASDLDKKHQAEWNERTYPTEVAMTMAAHHCDAFRALAYQLERELAARSATATPVEETEDSKGDWQCKDYADGWITFPTRKAAEKYQRQTGASMRYIRYYDSALDRTSDKDG